MTEGFDYPALVDELSCRPTEWLQARRTELVREQRRLRVEELAVVAVLDARGALDTDSIAAADGVPARALRETVETAHSLEDLPAVAAAAYAGAVSNEQLVPLARLADPESDAEWARRAPHTAPADLAHLARTRTSPSAADARRRREARHFRMWWSEDRGMLNVRGELPDVDGARVETTFTELIDRMRPAKGEAWASRDQRGADALVALCRSRRNHDAVGAVGSELPPVPVAKPLFVVEVPRQGPALVAGVPLPEAMVETLRAQANVEPVLVDDDGVPIARGRECFPRCLRRSPAACCCVTGAAAAEVATDATVCRSITSGRARGAAPTRSRTWSQCAWAAAPTTTRCSCPMGRGYCSATPTGRTASGWCTASRSTTSTTTSDDDGHPPSPSSASSPTTPAAPGQTRRDPLVARAITTSAR